MRASPVGTIYLLKRAELAVRSCMEVCLAEFSLTPTQFLMLFRLRDSHEMSAADLARAIGVRAQSIIEIIHPLERKRLLKREASPGNRRILQTRLTAAGHTLVADALRVAERIEAELLAHMDGDQISRLQNMLASLLERAESHELHPNSIRARAGALMRARPDRGKRRHRAPLNVTGD